MAGALSGERKGALKALTAARDNAKDKTNFTNSFASGLLCLLSNNFFSRCSVDDQGDLGSPFADDAVFTAGDFFLVSLFLSAGRASGTPPMV